MPVLTLPKPRGGWAAWHGRGQRGGWCWAARGASAGRAGSCIAPPRVVSAGDDFPNHHLLESITPSLHLLKSLPLLWSHANPGMQLVQNLCHCGKAGEGGLLSPVPPKGL